MENMINQPMAPIAPAPEIKKEGGKTILIIVIILLLISNIVTAYFLLTKDLTVDVEQDVALEQEPQLPNLTVPIEEERVMNTPELQTAVIGEPVYLDNYTVTVMQIVDPNENVDLDLMDGYKYVGIEILLENNTDDTLFYSTDWTLYDGDGYDYSKFSRTEPVFTEVGSIAVNGTTRGWLNFKTIEDATDFTVKFNDTDNNYSIEFSSEE